MTELVVAVEERPSRVVTEPLLHAQVRAELQSLGYSRLAIIGVAALGMRSDRVALSLEPDIEFLLIFAGFVETASREMARTPTVFLDDGILELSASFEGGSAWSRMGYLDDATKVEVDPHRLLSLWRGFNENVLRAAEILR